MLIFGQGVAQTKGDGEGELQLPQGVGCVWQAQATQVDEQCWQAEAEAEAEAEAAKSEFNSIESEMLRVSRGCMCNPKW